MDFVEISKYMNGVLKEDFAVYKKEYAAWVETMNILFDDPDDLTVMPDDDVLLSLALHKATEVMRNFNISNRKEIQKVGAHGEK